MSQLNSSFFWTTVVRFCFQYYASITVVYFLLKVYQSTNADKCFCHISGELPEFEELFLRIASKKLVNVPQRIGEVCFWCRLKKESQGSLQRKGSVIDVDIHVLTLTSNQAPQKCLKVITVALLPHL